MGVWGDAYGPEGGRRQSEVSTLSSFTGSKSQFILDGSPTAYQPSFHLELVKPSSHFTISSLPRAQDHPLFYVGIYTLIGLATSIVTVMSIIITFAGALRASRLLFRRLLDAVVHATMRWHVSLSCAVRKLSI